MRYQLNASVVGDVFIESSCAVESDGVITELHADQTGRLVEVAVSLQIPADIVSRFCSSVGPGQGDSVATFTVGGDGETRELLVARLQTVESNLAFATGGALQRINWDEHEQQVIPENEDEKALVEIPCISRTSYYPHLSARLTQNCAESLLLHAPKYESLCVPKAFWREGMNAFTTFQYVRAFYDFYFVLEGFYANGKTGKGPVLKEFSKSQEFADIVKHTMKSITTHLRHTENLQRKLDEENCGFDVAGLQELLFLVRGNLHHYSRRKPRLQGTPFQQKHFETIAWVAMHLATLAIGYREARISQEGSE